MTRTTQSHSTPQPAPTDNAIQIIRDLYSANLARPTVFTVGNFDGIHRGHQALLAELRRLADHAFGAPARAGILTFDPHPLVVLRPGAPIKLLTTPDERVVLAAQYGIDIAVIHPFSEATASLEPRAFMELMVKHLGLAALVAGPDFALGRERRGSLDILTALGDELGYRVVVLEPVDWQGKAVRSNAIRQLLAEGRVVEAADLLGRAYSVSGVVVHGDHRGRQIGLPTANLQPPAGKLWPADGVYATRATIQGDPEARVYASVTNLGVRPTVGGLDHRLETHLLDFPPPGVGDDLYGRTLTVEFVQRLRGEQRFAGLPELVAQIHADIAAARTLLEP